MLLYHDRKSENEIIDLHNKVSLLSSQVDAMKNTLTVDYGMMIVMMMKIMTFMMMIMMMKRRRRRRRRRRIMMMIGFMRC